MTASVQVSGYWSGNAQLSDLFDDLEFLSDFDVEVNKLTLDLDYESRAVASFSFSAYGSAGFQLIGESKLLSAQDVVFSIKRTPPQSQSPVPAPLTTQVTFQGVLDILGEQVLVKGAVSASDTYFTVQLLNGTLGDVLSYFLSFIGLGDTRFEGEWAFLNHIQLDQFVFEFDVTNACVMATVDVDVSVGFASITSVGVSYNYSAPANGGSSSAAIQFSLGGSFLGHSFGRANTSSALAWDPSNPASSPPIPGGNKLFQLRYLGVGQHLSLTDAQDITSIDNGLSDMEQALSPTATLGNGLVVNGQAGWLIGADFIVANTVHIRFLFNDPELYGIYIALSGAHAKSLAGLSLSILYKNIGAGIGEYSTQLVLPYAMQHLSFGEVNLTLPTIGIDIYTNSDFQIDLGFPFNNDFSTSFAIDVEPFSGHGGFYFGKLPEAAVISQLPVIGANGRFSPILDFGMGLTVGLGFDGSYGPLSVHAFIGVEGIIQGLFAIYHPTNPHTGSVLFYKLSGLVGIQGSLRGSINFVIISASVDIALEADVAFVYECYEPLLLDVQADVEASASVSFFFFTAHFSFDFHFEKSFCIGSESAPPWASVGTEHTAQLPHN